MKKLNLAIIGNGKSGKDIHGAFYRTEQNVFFNVKYVVDADERIRKLAEQLYPGCETLCDYHELFDKEGIDLVVNSTFSNQHYEIAKDLLNHGFNVLTEKPFARTRFECQDLINTAKKKGVVLAVFQQSFLAPFYKQAQAWIKEGKFGEIKQVSINYSGFSRRWDWQTLQKRLGGNLYNTGPHPIGLALGFLDFAEDYRVAFSATASTPLTSGDADDYAKVILTAPGKPVVDVEISSMDAFPGYNLKVQGTKGTLKCTLGEYECKYIVDGENVERPVCENSLRDENGIPYYCKEDLVAHVESGKFGGTAFDVAVSEFYENLYYAITEGRELLIKPEIAANIINVIETVHAQNNLPLVY